MQRCDNNLIMTVLRSMDHIAPLGVINRINSGTNIAPSGAKPVQEHAFEIVQGQF